MKSSNRLIAAMLVVALLAGGFWILVLSPKREEATNLSSEVEQLQSSLALAEGQAAEAEAARRKFPEDYRKLVVLGAAVPEEDETSSLLVSLSRISDRADIEFDSIQLNEGASSEVEGGATSLAPEAGPTTPVTSTVPPTEAAASLQPLGSTIGPAGLAVMPYSLSFRGSFFDVADFIHGIDSLVTTKGAKTLVDGRLVTLDGFVLTEDSALGFPSLNANFSVTTYLAPAGQGVTAGATEAAPPAVGEVSTESSTGTPSSFPTNQAQ